MHNGYRPDFCWDANRDGTRKHITHPGWYHYLVHDRDPVDQAHDFINTLGAMKPGEWSMLDAEAGDLRFDGTDVARAEAFLATVAEAYPHNPHTIYSEGSSFTGPLAGVSARWPKIVASVLTATSPRAPDWLQPHMGEVGWQFSWAHPFPGIDTPCDADRFSGNLDQWRAAIGMHAAPEPHVTRPSHVPLPPPGTSYERGDGGNNAQGWGVAALQNGLRFVTGARLFPSSPPTFGAETERAVHDFQVFFKLVPSTTPVRGCSAGERTVALLNLLIDTK